MASKAKSKSNDAETFSKEEKAAMRARARELKNRQDGEGAVKEAIAEMPKADRDIAKRIDAIVKKSAPGLTPKTWYGMPAYANADGKVVCFFQSADKFGSRYATFGFNDAAKLDKGSMWPTTFAITKLTGTGEKEIARLVKRAAS